jgi:hypothetical protein
MCGPLVPFCIIDQGTLRPARLRQRFRGQQGLLLAAEISLGLPRERIGAGVRLLSHSERCIGRVDVRPTARGCGSQVLDFRFCR